MAAVALAVVVSGCGASTARPATRGLHFGAFSGYQWLGHVHSVSATLTVPSVKPRAGAPLAISGTWIGAQAIGAGGHKEAFIQVGVNEASVGRRVKGMSAGLLDHAFYWAFWSDTARHFHPVPLFSVQAGDRVSVSMVLSGGRWRITAIDGSVRNSFETDQETHASFQMASWAQEDVTENIRTARLSPYPDVSSPSFGSLSVDGHVPGRAGLNPTWMLIDGTVLRPTPITGAGFTLVTGEPALTRADVRFLRVLSDTSQAGVTPEAELSRITIKTPRSQIARWVAQTDASWVTADRELRTVAKPALAASEAATVISANQRSVALAKSLAALPARGYAHWRVLWNAAAVRGITATARLLRVLDLPEMPVESKAGT